MIDWLFRSEDEVPSPESVAVWIHFGHLRPEEIPLWAAHWLVAGYDGEHLVRLAGLHGDDPREVRDVLPCALRDCGVQMPESDVAAAGAVFKLIARMYLEGAMEAGTVIGVVGAVLSWSGYPDSIRDMPLGHLLYIEDEWNDTWGRTRNELAEVVRQVSEEQMLVDLGAMLAGRRAGARDLLRLAVPVRACRRRGSLPSRLGLAAGAGGSLGGVAGDAALAASLLA